MSVLLGQSIQGKQKSHLAADRKLVAKGYSAASVIAREPDIQYSRGYLDTVTYPAGNSMDHLAEALRR